MQRALGALAFIGLIAVFGCALGGAEPQRPAPDKPAGKPQENKPAVKAQETQPPAHPQESKGAGKLTSIKDVMQRKPDLEKANVLRVWVVEKEEGVRSVLLIELIGTQPWHIHPDGAHSIFMLEGSLQWEVGAEKAVMSPGDYIRIPTAVRHRVSLASGHSRALYGAVDSPPIDPQKLIWLDKVDPGSEKAKAGK